MNREEIDSLERVDLRAVLQASKEVDNAKAILAETKKRERENVASAKLQKDECQKTLENCLKNLEDEIGEEQVKYLKKVFGAQGASHHTRNRPHHRPGSVFGNNEILTLNRNLNAYYTHNVEARRAAGLVTPFEPRTM